MADEPTVDFSQVTGFKDALEKSPKAFIPFAVDAMTATVRIIQGGMAEYPPATEANQPGRFSLRDKKPMGYYERGRGWWYPVMTKETLESAAAGKYGKSRGVVKASALQKKVSRVMGYKLAGGGESEQLGKSWTTRIRSSDTGVEGEVGTDTTYAPYAQGKQKQSSVLAKYGWDEHTMEYVMDELAPQLNQIWSEAADAFVKQLAGA